MKTSGIHPVQLREGPLIETKIQEIHPTSVTWAQKLVRSLQALEQSLPLEPLTSRVALESLVVWRWPSTLCSFISRVALESWVWLRLRFKVLPTSPCGGPCWCVEGVRYSHS